VGGTAALLVLGAGGGQAFGARSHAIRHQASDSARSNVTAVNLQAMPRGTVSLRQNGGRLEATISTFGLTPGSTHGAEITGGEVLSLSRSSRPGQAAAKLTSIGRVSTLSRHAVFQIEFSTSPGQPIAEAPVGASRHGRSVGLQAVESGGEGSLAGSAHLNYDASAATLTARVDANGFLPDSDHAAHLHSGSCDVQGAVMVMLTDLHAGQNGQIHQTDVVRNLASFTAPSAGWYLNIHEGTSATILNAAGQPTP
jgi:CHRD domain